MLRRGSLGNLSQGHTTQPPSLESGFSSLHGEMVTQACWAPCHMCSLAVDTKGPGYTGRGWCTLVSGQRSPGGLLGAGFSGSNVGESNPDQRVAGVRL